MRTASFDEVFAIEDAVAVVDHVRRDHIFAFRGSHTEIRLRRLVKAPFIVHVGMKGAVVPAARTKVAQALQSERNRRVLAGFQIDVARLRQVFEPLHGSDVRLPGGDRHAEGAGSVKHPITGTADQRERIGRRVQLAIARRQMNPGRDGCAGRGVDRADRHRTLPPSAHDAQRLLFSVEGLKERQLRQALLVRDVRDPFAVGRPSRVEGIVGEKGRLGRVSAGQTLKVQILVTIS